MIKLALCGAHGTGKTTLLKDISKLLPETDVLKRTIRTFWKDHGVHDFDLLPKEVRTEFQKHLLLNQIKREDEEGGNGFITDRSVVDYVAFAVHNSDMKELDLALYKSLIKERLKNYTHLIYVPIMFDAEDEHLRANVESRHAIATIMEDFLKESLPDSSYLTISKLRHEHRIEEIKDYLQITE